MIPRKDIILSVLRRNGGSMPLEDLARECQRIQPLKAGEKSYITEVKKRKHRDKWIIQYDGTTAIVYLKTPYREGSRAQMVLPIDDNPQTPQPTPQTENNSQNQNDEPRLSPNGYEVIVPPVEDFIPDPERVPKFVDYARIHNFLEVSNRSGRPLLLVGPKGIGKTLSIASYAAKHHIPLIQVDCSESTKRGDLLGRFILEGDRVKFVLGLIPLAYIAAEKYGKAILLFEELNALPPHMQKMLNSLLDWRRQIIVPEIGKVFRTEHGELLIAATMNPSSYGGTYELNEDLKSRFMVLAMDYPPKNTEMRIVREVLNLEDEHNDLLNRLENLAKELRNGEATGQVSFAPSPRDLIQFFEIYRSLSESDEENRIAWALMLSILNKYEDPEEIKFVKERIMSTLGVRL